MLKEFELGSIGRRLALWQKIKRLQEEVRISGAVPRTSSVHSTVESSKPESIRNRSTSVGLPRIPSLMENSGSRTPTRQGVHRSPSHQQTRSESNPTLPSTSDTFRPEHAHRPSAASIRSLNQEHNRRHSSIDYTSNSPRNSITSPPLSTSPTKRTSHVKQGSMDDTWTMGAPTQSPTDINFKFPAAAPAAPAEPIQPPTIDSDFVSFPHEVGLTIVSSVDLDRGYFSGNDADVRKRRTLKKKSGDGAHHTRAPSDGYTPRRLSGLFRHSRAGSTDSVNEPGKASNSLAMHFGRSASRATSRKCNPKCPAQAE